MILEYHYKRVEDAYKFKGGDFIKQVFCLVGGIIGTILSLAWVIHILFYMFPLSIGQNYLTQFLDLFLIEVSVVPFVGPVMYAALSFYLLFCVIKGITSVGMNIGIMTLHPMK
jgi:LMBR1 domain-containing protein 1